MTIRFLWRWIGEHALRGFARAVESPHPPVLSAQRPIKVLAICPNDHDHLLLRLAAFHDGWYLSLARSFSDAIPLLRRDAYSIVLYDADLPAMHWCQALRRLAAPAYDRIVILLTARRRDDLWCRAIEIGAFDVLERPILGSELLSLVGDARQILETVQAQPKA